MTRNEIKDAALKLVEAEGLINLSRAGLCKVAGIPDGSFPHVMGCTFTEFVAELTAEGVSSQNHPVNKSRTSPDLRRAQILETAVAVAKEFGYTKLTRKNVGLAAGSSPSLVGFYFPLMIDLRTAVMGQAVRHEIPEIIAQGLAEKDAQALRVPTELKNKAVAILIAAR